MENNPIVSVIIPCYNHQKYIEECILSVVKQSYKNIQIIVIDDGSKDDSVEIIEELQLAHHFIFESQKNIGLSATLNKAIKNYANGKYIAVVASDDYWHQDKINLQVQYYESNPNYGMIFSSGYIVNNDSAVISSFNLKRFKPPYTFNNLIQDKFGVPALTTMVKKEVYDKVGFFDETLLMEDWDMWLRIVAKYEIGFLNEKTAYYRMHDSNISSKLALMMDDRFKIIAKWKAKYPAVAEKALKFWRIEAFALFAITDKTLAKKYLDNSLGYLINYKYCRNLYKYLFLGRF